MLGGASGRVNEGCEEWERARGNQTLSAFLSTGRRSKARRGREPVPRKQGRLSNLLAHRLALGEQVQVIRAAGLRVGSRHIESAERLRTDHGAGALTVDVQVADVKFANGAGDLVFGLGVHRAGQSKLGIVGDFQSVIVVL